MVRPGGQSGKAAAERARTHGLLSQRTPSSRCTPREVGLELRVAAVSPREPACFRCPAVIFPSSPGDLPMEQCDQTIRSP